LDTISIVPLTLARIAFQFLDVEVCEPKHRKSCNLLYLKIIQGVMAVSCLSYPNQNA
jgi:hypothetical protein